MVNLFIDVYFACSAILIIVGTIVVIIKLFTEF